MQRVVSARLTIAGNLADESFAGWIVERGCRLSLAGGVRRVSQDRIDVIVEGPEALVEAMEIACTLGPAGVLVDDVERETLERLPAEIARPGCTRFVHLAR